MSWVSLAIGAGVGLVKSEAVDKPKEERDRKLAAETQRYSPWTGLKAQPIKEADPFGSALQYGATAASMKAGQGSQAAQNNLTNAQANYFNNGAAKGPWDKPFDLNDYLNRNSSSLTPYGN